MQIQALGYKLLIIIFILFSTSCFSSTTTQNTDKEVSISNKTDRKNELAKLVKLITLVEKYYVEKINLKEVITISIEELKFYYKNQISTEVLNSIEQIIYKNNSMKYTQKNRIEFLTNLTKTIAMIEKYSFKKVSLDSLVSMLISKLSNRLNNRINKQFDVKKDKTIQKKISLKIIENKYLYLKISEFDKGVSDKAKKIIQSFDKKGILLDLRDNSGGLLNESISLADFFIDKGIISLLKSRGKVTETYLAKQESTITKHPLVVLVNSSTVSGSEVVAGALKDHKRAIIVGEKTFGYSSIQMLFPISSKDFVKLSVAKVYTPSGQDINEKIIPDIKVDYDDKYDTDLQLNKAIDILDKITKK